MPLKPKVVKQATKPTPKKAVKVVPESQTKAAMEALTGVVETDNRPRDYKGRIIRRKGPGPASIDVFATSGVRIGYYVSYVWEGYTYFRTYVIVINEPPVKINENCTSEEYAKKAILQEYNKRNSTKLFRQK